MKGLLSSVEWKAIDRKPESRLQEGEIHATHEGLLEIYGAKFRCYRLSNGEDVFDADDVAAFFSSAP